jgi:hypothetical protein
MARREIGVLESGCGFGNVPHRQAGVEMAEVENIFPELVNEKSS